MAIFSSGFTQVCLSNTEQDSISFLLAFCTSSADGPNPNSISGVPNGMMSSFISFIGSFEFCKKFFACKPKGSYMGVGIIDEIHGEGRLMELLEISLFSFGLASCSKNFLLSPLKRLRAGLSINDMSGDFWKKFCLEFDC